MAETKSKKSRRRACRCHAEPEEVKPARPTVADFLAEVKQETRPMRAAALALLAQMVEMAERFCYEAPMHREIGYYDRDVQMQQTSNFAALDDVRALLKAASRRLNDVDLAATDDARFDTGGEALRHMGTVADRLYVAENGTGYWDGNEVVDRSDQFPHIAADRRARWHAAREAKRRGPDVEPTDIATGDPASRLAATEAAC